jgi:hypothetical protein
LFYSLIYTILVENGILGEGQKMKANQRQRGKISRALVALLTFGSLLGVTSGPAMAEEKDGSWTVEIYVEDSTCVPTFDPPDWNPDLFVSYVESAGPGYADIASGPVDVSFYVGLGISAGFDDCLGSNIEPTGEVETSYTNIDVDSPLTLNSLSCESPFPCNAVDIYGDALGGQIDGVITVADTAVPDTTYTGELRVVWTLTEDG